jgi:dsRNA-specific ribonuclease
MKNYIIVAAISLLIGAIGVKFLFPTIKEKIVEKEVEVIKKDVQTVIKEIIKPDGTKEIVTVVTDKSQEKKESSKVTTVSKPDWNIGLGTGIDKNKDEYYLALVQRRVIGELFVGAMATTKKDLGVVISYSF